MAKHKIEKTAPTSYRVPENIPEPRRYATILCDFPWARAQGGRLGAIEKYDLMSMERILEFPLDKLAADNCMAVPAGSEIHWRIWNGGWSP